MRTRNIFVSFSGLRNAENELFVTGLSIIGALAHAKEKPPANLPRKQASFYNHYNTA